MLDGRGTYFTDLTAQLSNVPMHIKFAAVATLAGSNYTQGELFGL